MSRRTLRGRKNCRQFICFSKQSLSSFEWDDTRLCHQLQPKNGFIRFFYYDTHPGNKFSL